MGGLSRRFNREFVSLAIQMDRDCLAPPPPLPLTPILLKFFKILYFPRLWSFTTPSKLPCLDLSMARIRCADHQPLNNKKWNIGLVGELLTGANVLSHEMLSTWC